MLLQRLLMCAFLVLATVYLASAQLRSPDSGPVQVTQQRSADGWQIRLEVTAAHGTRSVNAVLSDGRAIRLKQDLRTRRWWSVSILPPISVTLQSEGQTWTTLSLTSSPEPTRKSVTPIAWGRSQQLWAEAK